ncbi:MAG: N-acetyltransferase [Opitutae bacterium]|nr:N-acetyltransferase [Opitutae bacterium]
MTETPRTHFVAWGPDQAGKLASLWAVASPGELLSIAELDRVVFADSGIVLASPDASGAVVAVTRESQGAIRGYVKLIVVHPDARRHALGRRLLAAAEAWMAAHGATTAGFGGGVPLYLWPGVDVVNLPTCSLAQSAGYRVTGCAVNLRISTGYRSAMPPRVSMLRFGGGNDHDRKRLSALRALVTAEWPAWLTEFDLGALHGALFGAFTDDAEGGTIPLGFFAHSTLRTGWIGPLGTHPRYRQRGVGAALLSAVCADLQRIGFTHAEIAWVGPLSYFADKGAVHSRAFRQFSKTLSPVLSPPA